MHDVVSPGGTKALEPQAVARASKPTRPKARQLGMQRFPEGPEPVAQAFNPWQEAGQLSLQATCGGSQRDQSP